MKGQRYTPPREGQAAGHGDHNGDATRPTAQTLKGLTPYENICKL
jgi:hypothetical protein